MLDFKELSQNGDDFELLVRELLYNKGLEVYWSGKGPDGGKDLLCIETYKSNFKSITKRWLIQCKHNAHSGKSVGTSELGSIENSCLQHNADGYLLVCSTYPSSSVVSTLDGIEHNSKLTTSFWDYRTLERQLLVPENWSLVNMFFPKSAQNLQWQISKIDTYFWHANYKGNIFYFSLRIGTNCDHYLKYIADRIEELHQLHMLNEHYLRIRAVYFDDKYTNFTLYLDYLVPSGTTQEEFNPPAEVIDFCHERIIDGVYYNIDLAIYEYNGYSDNFDLDHQSYYSYYLSDFKTGCLRHKTGNLYSVFRDNPFCYTEKITNDAFNNLSDIFCKLPFIRVLKITNAQIEKISYFTDNFSWIDTIQSTGFNLDNFFDTEIRFECDSFKDLCDLLSTFPQSVNQHFSLVQDHIFLPDTGYDSDEDTIFTLHIKVHPAIAISKLQFRKYLNQYMSEIKDAVSSYIENLESK